MKKISSWLILAGLLLPAFPALAANPLLVTKAREGKAASSPQAAALPENLPAAEVDALISRLSDEQVRRLLIAELQADAQAAAAAERGAAGSGLGGFIQWFETRTGLLVSRLHRLGMSLPEIPGDIGRALQQLTDYQGAGRFAVMVLAVLALLAVGCGAETLFYRSTRSFRARMDDMPVMEGILKFWGALLQLLPELLGLLVFALTPLMLFFMTVDKEDKGLRLLFLAFLLTVLAIRLCASLLRWALSPRSARTRLLPLSDAVAGYLYRRLLLAVGILVVGMILQLLLERLGATLTTRLWLILLYGTTIVLIFAGMVWRNRQRVQEHLMQREAPGGERSFWLREQFAAMWHTLALAYLFLVLGLGAVSVVTADAIRFRGTFIISLLIVPIYLALDRLACWCLAATVAPRIETLAPLAAGDGSGDAAAPEEDAPPKTRGRYLAVARRVVRLVVFAAVVLWFLDIWGLQVPIGEAAVAAIFNILVALLVAHVLWELISAAISRKLAQGGYVEAAEKEGEDDEWGAGAPLDRSHTLLPMLRKFMGVVIVVMTTLIVLSALGVDIGPLLAGAGVVGLAIGFGAQKLVRDILSGIFFLMDDAFRVGEYLDAGGVSGTVEAITLRTLKLRHHRGMLQIVPLGDLKSITNFMRGGMVVKFDLQLPYDTDIDQVRKIVKKVGKQMLLDEDLGPDILKPVKSQGVRSVGDSVMTFRVKFTARPGTHFVIRREAFRRITEALEKKGIKYAHRKVIVDLSPELAEKMDVGPASTARAGEEPSGTLTPEQKKELIAAGAAAALDTIVEGDQENSKKKKKN